MVELGRPRVLCDPGPQLKCALDQLGHLAVGVHPPGGNGGLDARAKGCRLIAGGEVVAGDHRSQLEVTVTVGGVRLERHCQRQMPFAALAGEQIVVQGLAQQCMAKAEALLLLGDQNLLGERLAERHLRRVPIGAGDGRDRLLVERAADGDSARRPLGIGR